MGRLIIAVIVVVVIVAVVAWCLVELRPGADKKAQEAAERREREEAAAGKRYPIATVVRCAACGAEAAEIRETPIVSERRREIRALVACSACGVVQRQRLGGLRSLR